MVKVYLELDITLSKNENSFFNLDGGGNIDEPFPLVIDAFANSFCIAILSLTGGEEIEINKHFGQI